MEIASPPIELPCDHTPRWHDNDHAAPRTSGGGDKGDDGSVDVQAAESIVTRHLFDTARLHPGRRVFATLRCDHQQRGYSESVDESGADDVVVTKSRMDPRRAWGLVVRDTGMRETLMEADSMTVEQCIECVANRRCFSFGLPVGPA